MKTGNGMLKAEKILKNDADSGFFVLLLLVVSVGLVSLFSASWYLSEKFYHVPHHFLVYQFVWIVMGLAGALVISRIPIHIIRRGIPWFIAGTIILNLLTYLPGVGHVSGGARRWISLFGYTFQPSELVRIAVVLYLAHIFDKKEKRLNDYFNTLIPPFLVVCLFCALIYFQNDFSTSAYIFVLSIIMFFIAGVSLKFLSVIIGGFVLAAIGMVGAKAYRLDRIRTWLNPEIDPRGAGYHMIKAREALQNGGLWGTGFGRGESKLGKLYSAHSDFVGAVIGEEAGLVGVAAVLLIFLLFTLKGYGIALRLKDPFYRYAIFGLMTSIYLQVLTNLSVVCGLVPATGIPLPFFSVAGSSAFITLLICGLVFNFQRNQESVFRKEVRL